MEEMAKLVQVCALELQPELFAGVPHRVLMYTVINHELTQFSEAFFQITWRSPRVTYEKIRFSTRSAYIFS